MLYALFSFDIMVLKPRKEDKFRQPVKCDDCGKIVQKQSIYDHRKIHANKRFTCKVCKKEYTQSGTLKRHMVEIHRIIEGYVGKYATRNRDKERQKRVECNICNKKFRCIRNHIQTHTGFDKMWKCNQCGKKCTSQGNLKIHEKIHLSTRNKSKCSICDNEYIDIKDHLKRHQNKKSVKMGREKSQAIKNPKTSKIKVIWYKKGHKVTNCNICLYVGSDIRTHMKEHKDKDGILLCDICNLRMYTTPELLKHKSKKHTVNISVECAICKEVFDTETDLKIHKKAHPKDKKKCTLCGEMFKNLKGHIKEHENKNSKECRICSRMFTQGGTLKRHMVKIHGVIEGKLGKYDQKHKSQSKYFRCNICMKELKGSLKEHMKIHTGEKNHKCNVCNKAFTQSGVLKRLMEKIHCDRCNFVTAEKSILEKHIMKVHEQKPAFTCQFCDKGFSEHRRLKDHVNQHHLQQTTFECDICKKHFRQQRILRVHREGVHKIFTRTFSCNYCQKEFPRGYIRNCHMKTHILSKQLECSKCEKKFAQPTDLENHKIVEHNMSSTEAKHPNFQCTLCPKSYSSKKYLNEHLKQHENESVVDVKVFGKGKHIKESSFFCKICGGAFKSKRGDHMRIHTGEKRHKCDKCDKSFTQSGVLKRHLERHEKFTGRTLLRNNKEKQNITKRHLRNRQGIGKKNCSICGMMVVNLSRHLESHQNEDSFQCNVCDERYTNDDTRRNHMVAKHGIMINL